MAKKKQKKSKFMLGTDINDIKKQHFSKEGQKRKKEIDKTTDALIYRQPGLVRFEGDWKVAIKTTVIVIAVIFIFALFFALIINQEQKLYGF